MPLYCMCMHMVSNDQVSSSAECSLGTEHFGKGTKRTMDGKNNVTKVPLCVKDTEKRCCKQQDYNEMYGPEVDDGAPSDVTERKCVI